MSEEERVKRYAAPITMLGISYAILFGGTQGGGAPPPPPTGTTIHVQDSSTGQPLAGATVILASATPANSSQGSTDSNGNWTSPSPPGSYLLTVSLSSYVTFQQNVSIASAQVLTVSLVFSPPGPGPGAVTFVSFIPKPANPISVWTNGTSLPISAICYVVVKNSSAQTVAIGTAGATMNPGQTIAFTVPLSPTLQHGTYEFDTFIINTQNQPVSATHIETDTI